MRWVVLYNGLYLDHSITISRYHDITIIHVYTAMFVEEAP